MLEVLSLIILTYDLVKVLSNFSFRMQVSWEEISNPGPTAISSFAREAKRGGVLEVEVHTDPEPGGEHKERKTSMRQT